MNAFLIEHLIILKTFVRITGHTGDTIKNDGVFFFYGRDEFVPMWSALSSTGVELTNNGGFGIEFRDVRDLASDALMFG